MSLHDRVTALGWLSAGTDADTYDVSARVRRRLPPSASISTAPRALRRRFASACLDWSERRPHLGGALGAALLTVAIKRKWVVRELDSRALRITAAGQRELRATFGVAL